MATVVTYNGIRLNNVITRQWEEEIVYDNSGTDAIHHKFHLAFEGVLHVKDARDSQRQWVDTEAGKVANDVANLETYVRKRLAEPRKELYVRLVESSLDHGGIPVDIVLLHAKPRLSVAENGTYLDVDNGPKPRTVSITQVVADKLLRINFSIECALVECPNQNYLPAIINNRWSVGEELDENFFSTKTIRGRLRLSHALVSPHKYKPVMMPPLESGFKRTRVTFVASENGLEAEYEIVDRQVHTSAPWPATSINGSYSMTTADGVNFFSEVEVELRGSPAATRADLLTRAIQVVDAKLGIQNLADNDFLWEQFALVEAIGPENMVKAVARIRHVGIENKEQFSNLRTKYMAKRLVLPALRGNRYDARVSTWPAPWGENPQGGIRGPVVGLFLLHCLLQSPCAPDATKTIFGFTYFPAQPAFTPNYTTRVEAYQAYTPLATGEPDYYDKTHAEALYTAYTLRSRYVSDRCKVQMPLADPDINEAKDDTSLVVSLAKGQARREITLEGERVGKWPDIPEPVDSYSDGSLRGTLLTQTVTPHAPRLSADGRKLIYQVEAQYVYALNRPPQKGELRRVGVIPFTKLQQADAAYVPKDYYPARLTP